jgi:hypothetical protein
VSESIKKTSESEKQGSEESENLFFVSVYLIIKQKGFKFFSKSFSPLAVAMPVRLWQMGIAILSSRVATTFYMRVVRKHRLRSGSTAQK